MNAYNHAQNTTTRRLLMAALAAVVTTAIFAAAIAPAFAAEAAPARPQINKTF
jgi:hypothetical protein